MRSISGALAQVPITAAPGMDARVVASSPAFAEWVSEDQDPALFVQDIHIQSVDMFGPRVGYVKFKTTAKARIDDQTVIDVPGIVFMRGGSVGVLVILECDGTEYTILTRQPRVPVGRHDFPEIPAGMLDGSGNFKGVAADEIQQECGITIQETELCDLTQLAYEGQFKGVIPSAGACDEFIRLYTVARHVDREVIDKLQGQLTGMLSEGEVIKLEIIELSKLWETSPDAKALSALALRDYLKLHHRLPGSRGQKALSVMELSHDDEDGIHRGGKFQEGLPESQASPTALAKVDRLSKAWSYTSVDAEIEEQSEHPANLPTDKHGGNGSLDAPPAEPTYVKQAKKERARRRSVSFGHENRAAMKSLAAQDDVQGERRLSVSFGQVSDSIPPPGLIATKSSAAGSKGPSPRSAMRRGSLQHTYLQQQHASTTTGSNESSSGASRPSVTIAVEHPHGSAPDAHYPSINNIETSRWAPPMGTADVMLSRNSTDPSRNPFATKDFGFRDETFGVREGGNQSLASAQREHALLSSHDDEHATMSADEDEVDRLMMEDLLEATQSTLVLGSGSRRDVVVKVKVVHEPPTYLAALYAKADASNQVQSVLMVLTIVALFGDDFRVVFLPKGADPIASAITFVIFIIFSLEWMCNCLFKPAYLYSLFFWLDIMATMSLITDVTFIYEAIFGEMTAISTIETVCQPAAAHVGTTADALMAVDSTSGTGEIESTGRAARVASRTARVVRILRVLRVIRIFKLLKFLGRKSIVVEEDPKYLRNSTTKMGERLVERISHRVIMIVLVLFVGTILVLQGFEPIDYGPQTGLDWMGSMRTNSTIGGAPIISNMAANTYVASVHQIILCLKDVGEGGVLFRHMPELISTRRDIEIQVNWAADASVLSATDHRESIVSQAWTNLTTIGVLLIIMVGSNYVFSHDIEELVVRKISVIVDSVNKMAVTLKFLGGEKVEDDEEDEEEMETEMIETAMEKMSELLRIGYGHAGNTIISKNLRGTGELNAMLPGQHVTAVFGFCDIRQFNEITDVLRGQVMPFVNQIAKIVHEEVVLNDGAPNKNIGDAFLCSWKTEEFTETPRSQKGLDQDEQKKHKLRMRRLSLAKPSSKDMDALAALAENGDLEIPLEYHTKADQALKSFVDIIAKLRSRKTELILRKRHPRLYMHRPSFKVDMGFGLHHGWAIEGAIGSVHKVDVSYLSPHVNMSARLEAATKQFGVPLLLSGSFVKLLSAGVR
jgi:class 3 adenylate cyclase